MPSLRSITDRLISLAFSLTLLVIAPIEWIRNQFTKAIQYVYRRIKSQAITKGTLATSIIAPLVPLVITLVVIGLIVYATIYASSGSFPDWVGLGPYTSPQPKSGEVYQPAKTLWDWAQLLIVPIALALTAFFLNRSERLNQQRLETQRFQEATLQTYLDQITELLLKEDIEQLKTKGGLLSVARVKTLIAFQTLDLEKRATLLQFLSDAKLLNNSNNSFDIIDFTRVRLQNINLEDSDFRNAYLAEINLQGANLTSANFKKAQLQNADLSYANLESADFSECDLSNAKLIGANLQGCNLTESKLVGCDLRRAKCISAKLAKANLTEADLTEADFSQADFDHAIIQLAISDRANFLKSNLSEEQKNSLTPGLGTRFPQSLG